MFGEKWMFIGAHPDDIEIGAGGTISRVLAHGGSVTAVVCTKPDTDRINESISSLCSLGVDKSRQIYLNESDGNFLCNRESVSRLESVIDKLYPDHIVTHHYNDTHQDHRVAYETTVAAARHYNSIFMYDPVYPSGRSCTAFHPNLNVILNKKYIDSKIRALKKHKSQLAKYGNFGWLEGLSSRAKYRGYETGERYAESFEIVRFSI